AHLRLWQCVAHLARPNPTSDGAYEFSRPSSSGVATTHAIKVQLSFLSGKPAPNCQQRFQCLSHAPNCAQLLRQTVSANAQPNLFAHCSAAQKSFYLHYG